jgi:type IV pilus assembly protein PilC
MKATYTAKGYSGEIKSGQVSVKDERELANQLRAEGFVLTSFNPLEDENEKKIKIKFLDRIFGIPLSEKMMFTRNLSVMIASGLSISKALKNLSLQTKNKKFIKVLGTIQDGVQAGSPFSDGLAQFPGIFNELFVNMVRIGETGGNLEEILIILADQLEKEHDLLRKVRGALVYPAVIVVAMLGIGVLMMIYVIPQITKIFTDMNVELPMLTRLVIGLSGAMVRYWLVTILTLIVLAVSLKIFSVTLLGKKVGGFVIINLPLIGGIVVKLNCARFCRIYSSLLKSGISVTKSLEILSRTLSNFYYQRTLLKAVDDVQKGINLSKVIYAEKKIFPILVPQMIEVGEETGKTEEVLAKLADFYEEEVSQITKNLSSIIEPILMLFIGGAVGIFAVSIIQPMYSVMENIK